MSILLGEADGKFETRALEVHVTHMCNLHCDGCKHYSNYSHKGELDIATFGDWVGDWSKVLQPKKLRLLGGEPTLHSKLTQFLYIARKTWPETLIYITTNGYFIDRHPDLLTAMIETQARLSLSFHSNEPAYLKKLKPIREGLKRHREETGLDLMETDVTSSWTKNYTGNGQYMKPFDDHLPEESWNNCTAKHCMQLHQNRLWKCAPVAYLRMQLEKFQIADDPDWSSYLKYQSLGLDASKDEMREFLSVDSEPVCSMCPAHPPKIFDKSIDWKDMYRAPKKQFAEV